MTQKLQDQSVISTINFMVENKRDFFKFKKLVPVVSNYSKMLILNGVTCCALHTSTKEIENIFTEDDDKEQSQIDDGLLWIAILKGPANASFVKRFPSKSKMEEWTSELDEINLDTDETLLWLNA